MVYTVEQRLTRWLLMPQDLTGYDTLDFTQEYLSQMITTQRTTATMIAGQLRRGLIRYSRGKIHILDRVGLEHVTCMLPTHQGTVDGAISSQQRV